MSSRTYASFSPAFTRPISALVGEQRAQRQTADEDDEGRLQAKAGPGGLLRGHRFLRLPVSSPHRVQPQLTVGPPDDEYEREADQVADAVMRMPANEAESGPAVGRVQRACAACQQEDEKGSDVLHRWPLSRSERLQRQADGLQDDDDLLQRNEVDDEGDDEVALKSRGSGAPPQVSAGLQRRITASRSAGEPLAPSTRQRFEPSFGRDFRHVRVHAGSESGRLCRDLNARAFTLGPHIYFGSGEYRPSQSPGAKLLAHELTHVVQQGAAVQPGSPPGDRRSEKDR